MVMGGIKVLWYTRVFRNPESMIFQYCKKDRWVFFLLKWYRDAVLRRCNVVAQHVLPIQSLLVEHSILVLVLIIKVSLPHDFIELLVCHHHQHAVSIQPNDVSIGCGRYEKNSIQVLWHIWLLIKKNCISTIALGYVATSIIFWLYSPTYCPALIVFFYIPYIH